MNTGYLIYQAERPRGPAEQQRVDIAHAELARSARRRWHALTALLRGRRPSGHRPGRPAEHQAECLTECLTGQRA